MAKPGAHRKFYDFTTSGDKEDCGDKTSRSPKELIKYVAENITGANTVFSTPFGPRKVVYCDYIASGRSVKFIEEYINCEVLPQYGSTHTTSSVTALQTTLFRHEARDIIRNATQASEHDRVLFVSSGATGALQKLIHGLKLTEPPVVFVDPYAHHSSLLPWREIGAKVVRIRETRVGGIDSIHLEQMLKEHQDKNCRLIGCFTAASNITGILADDVILTMLLHKYGALAFWDYATAAPYVELKMNPLVRGDSEGLAHKDAIFFSMHKFLGGVQTPGVLIAKRNLFENPIPEVCGGGTVFFVSRDSHRYLQDLETREEGGTPAIVESIRAGLVMQMKNNITTDFITTRNRHLSWKLSEMVRNLPEIEALGNIDSLERLPVLSFVVRHPQSGLLLHHNFICAVLNDVFGIQARGGCACAGPYAQDLLGIDEDLAQRFEKLLVEDNRLDRSHLRRQHEHSNVEVLRPGFVRLNLPYSASDEEVEFIVSAVCEVCKNGWHLLPQYNFNPETGEWKHHNNLVFRERQWLQNISYAKGFFSYHRKDRCSDAPTYKDCLKEAIEINLQGAKASQKRQLPEDTILFQDEAAELRWFLLPSEAQHILQLSTSSSPCNISTCPPFTPLKYPLKDSELFGRPDFIWQPTESLKHTYVSDKVISGIQSYENDSDEERTYKHCKDTVTIENDSRTDTLQVEMIENKRSDDERISMSKCDMQQHDDSSSNMHEYIKSVALRNEPDVNSSVKDGTATLNESCTTNGFTTEGDISPEKWKDIEKTGDEKSYKSNSLENSITLKKKPKVVCEDLKCFIKRDDALPLRNILVQNKWHSPPKNVFNPTIEALQEFGMIQDGDHVLVCLSGGKDSLSLLHTLRQYQFYTKARGIKFTLGAVTVDPMSASYDPRPLVPYLASLGVPYFYEQQDILRQAADLENLNSICSFCSRMKRGRIYSAARREGYNVLAFGQHLDDLAESFMMSVFHNGRLCTMKAHYKVKEGDLRVIRPFVYVREKELRRFAESRKLPVIPENCPACFEAPKERHRVKQMLAQQEVLFPGLFWSLRTALHPVMAIHQTGMENALFGKNRAQESNAILSSKEDEWHT
ncbi:uncharacterized protein [Panulirus ornatus]